MGSEKLANLPRWKTSDIYPGLDSETLTGDILKLADLLTDLEVFVEQQINSDSERLPADAREAATVIAGYLERANLIGDLYETLETYLYCRMSTNSFDKRATKLLSKVERQKARIDELKSCFYRWLGALAAEGVILQEAIALNKIVSSHSFYLLEAAAQSRYLMSEDEESLASQLMLSGAMAWARLKSVITSQLKAAIEIDGKIEQTPLSIAFSYLSEPDGNLRERSYRAIGQAFSEAEEPLAACLNGIKGAVNTLNVRRGRQDAVHSSLDQYRIDREILETMLEAMRGAFPLLRRYLLAKAHSLGKERLSPWDSWAPVGNADRIYEWTEAQEFITEQFATYSPELKTLAERAFVEGWIDAEPHDGKRGVAFCARIPSVQESRILINYNGRLGQLATLAHELGHAYHNECLRDKSSLQADPPMTLAETASIFCETVITDAILANASDIDEELAVLDNFLQMASALTLNIYARYAFEKEIFSRREELELSANEFNELAARCYRETYRDSVTDGDLWPFLWAYLPHYYWPDRSFYNYPYTFGMLFSLGLYQIYLQGQAGFHEKYDQLLADSASGYAADLAKRFGIDLYQPAFWAGGYEIISQRVERFEDLVRQKVPA